MLNLVTLLLLSPVTAQDPVSVLPADAPFRLQGSPDMITGETSRDGATFSVLKKGATAYACEVQTPASAIDVKQGEVLYITYEARCLAAKNESQSGSWNIRVQRNAAPYDGPYESSGTVGKQWRRFHGAFRADKDYPKGQLVTTFHVANAVQTLEIRDFKWTDHGTSADPKSFPVTRLTYGGQEANAPWRAQAAAMIEKNRKSNLIVKTRPGTEVHFKMVRHAYPFATVTGVDPKRTDADAKKFFAFMRANYSRLTVPIYWSDWGWESPEQRAKYLANIAWARENGYRMKGHNIIWPSYQWAPRRTRDLDKNTLAIETAKAMDERLAALKDVPFENVDVVNELISEHDFEDKLGLGFVVDAFKKSRATWPKADLVYNDYLVQQGEDVNPKYIEYAQRLKQMGAPITMLGYQAHFAEALPSIPWLWKLLDTVNRETGLPMEITEFDLNSQDDEAQAQFTRDIVTAWFAHPQSRGFTMWGFWEGDHWIPSSAMIRKDWTLRPAAKVWTELVTKTWWTDVRVIADNKGIASVRGFQGDYEITVDGKTKKTFLGRPAVLITLE